MLTTEGIEALQKVKEQILSEPQKFDMGQWVNIHPECGTVACIAGWLVLNKFGVEEFRRMANEPGGISVKQEADKIIGCNGGRLFYTCAWPEYLKDEYESKEGEYELVGKAELAVKAIDWFIKLNKPKDE